MPTDEHDLEKGQGSVATAGTALTTEAPDLVWTDKRVRLTLETGYRIRQHFHFVGMYYWLPRDVMTAVSYSGFVSHIQRRLRGIVKCNLLSIAPFEPLWYPKKPILFHAQIGYETYTADLDRINKELGTIVVNNAMLGVSIFLLHLCLWTLVGVGVHYHWDTSMPGVAAVIAITSIGLVASTAGIVFAAVDCTDAIIVRDTLDRLQTTMLTNINNAHAPLPPGGPIVAWRWEVRLRPPLPHIWDCEKITCLCAAGG
jgi:hypothetical protein